MLTDPNLTVKESINYLALNNVEYHEMYFRFLLATRKIKSFKIFSSRVVPKSELVRIVKEKREK